MVQWKIARIEGLTRICVPLILHIEIVKDDFEQFVQNATDSVQYIEFAVHAINLKQKAFLIPQFRQP